MVALDKNHNVKFESNHSPNMVLALGALVLSGIGIGAYAASAKEHALVRQPEIVRQYDTAWSVVRRADKDAGINPDSVDMRPAVDRVVDQYGTNLKAGQKITVKLDR